MPTYFRTFRGDVQNFFEEPSCLVWGKYHWRLEETYTFFRGNYYCFEEITFYDDDLYVRTGQESNYLEVNIETEDYEAEPIEPVEQSAIQCNKTSVELIYAHLNLDYYESNYMQYFTFVNTQRFREVKESLDSDSQVCYNLDVKNSSGAPMGAFTCPLPFEHEDLTKCCGDPCAQFCCADNIYTSRDRNLNTLAFILILIFAAGLGLLFYFILGSIF